jgi:hypothetical protein
VASRRPDLSGADVLLRDEGERDAFRDRHTEWSRITLGGMTLRSLYHSSAHTYARQPGQPGSSSVRRASVFDDYQAPGWFTRNVFNQLVAFLTGRASAFPAPRSSAAGAISTVTDMDKPARPGKEPHGRGSGSDDGAFFGQTLPGL